MSIILPHPENPMHAENLNSIDKLEYQGFEGSDTTLSISLFEYNFIWRKMETETIFIYAIGNNKFERVSIDNKMAVEKEYNWVDWDNLFSTHCIELEDFDELPLEEKVKMIFDYYGFENIFGSSYWEGFEIKE